MTFVYAAAYVLVAIFVGLCGRHRRMGFVGSLLFALVLTPPIGLFLLYLFQEDVPHSIAPPRR